MQLRSRTPYAGMAESLTAVPDDRNLKLGYNEVNSVRADLLFVISNLVGSADSVTESAESCVIPFCGFPQLTRGVPNLTVTAS